ncbi:MAG: hypothetical protein M0Q21_04305 [Ignavibacteriaceae bacterium]|nr:hypothetical protein [Ignavibacteriaceae bacterium]
MEVLKSLQAIRNGSYTRQSMNEFIEFACKIALIHSRRHLKKHPQFFYHSDINHEDLAVDAVAELASDKNGTPFYNFLHSFTAWKPEIQTEKEAHFFLTSILMRKVHQQYQNSLAVADPFYAKILHNVEYLASKNGYIKNYYLGSCYLGKEKIPEVHKSFIDEDSFEELPVKLFIDKKNLLADIFTYLETETEFYPCIPHHFLIMRLKHINMDIFLSEGTDEKTEFYFTADEIIRRCLNKTYKKIDDTYVGKAKLEIPEGVLLKSAIMEITEDLQNGGLKGNLFHYVTPFSEGLSHEVYREKYHNILEYLVKDLKRSIAQELKLNL